MPRFTDRQHKGAQAAVRAERRADAEKRNALTVPERRRQFRLNPPTETVTEPVKRERRKK